MQRWSASVQGRVAAKAEAVDREGAFPSESIAALQAAGLLGALSSKESGGLGLGLNGAARVVQRVAEECGSTAMVLTMHYCGVQCWRRTEMRRFDAKLRPECI